MLKNLLSYLFPINIYHSKSDFNESIEVTLNNGKLVLDSKNANYSYGSLEKVLKFGLNEIGKDSILKMDSILILGLAGGSVVKTLVEEFEYKGKITGVEIDPTIIKVANDYFNLNQYKNLEIVIGDAKVFIENSKSCYDLIIIDIFSDTQMPDFLFNKSFFDSTIKCLNISGKIIFNTMVLDDNHKSRNLEYFKMVQVEKKILIHKGIQGFNDIFIVFNLN